MNREKNTENHLEEAVVSRERVFKGDYLCLDRLTVRLPDGSTAVREVAVVRDAAAVLPLDKDGCVHLVRQHRPAVGRTLTEVPAGLIQPGESPEDAARRECEEETGFSPHVLKKLITYAHAEGYSTGFITLFLGTELERTGRRPDPGEFVECVTMPFTELLGRIERNEVIDSKTILCAVLGQKAVG